MLDTLSPSIGTHLDRVREAHPGGLILGYTCEICGKKKSLPIHVKCSKIKQKRYAKIRSGA